MTLFSTITKGMADGAETLQANFAKLAKAITSIGDDGTMTVPNLNVTNLGVTGDGSPTVTAGPLFDLKFAIIQKKNNRVIAHLALGLKTTTGTPAWNNAVIATFPTGYISNISERYVALLGTPQNQGLVGFNANGDLTFKTNMISVGNGATSVASAQWVYINMEYDAIS